MPKVGVILSGCGFLDGSEIYEATLTLYFLDKAGAEVLAAAPNADQQDVINHIEKKPMTEKRNTLVEASRLMRGNIRDLKNLTADEIDALILPGGFGAAKNLCSFAEDGPDCTVNPDLEKLIHAVHDAGKPIGFICIAPAIAAKVLGKEGVTLTIGCDPGTAKALQSMGATHQECQVNEFSVDAEKKIVSTPAFMYEASIAKVGEGIEKLVHKVLELI